MEPLTRDEFVGLLFLAIIAGAAVLYVVQKVVFAILRRQSVNTSSPAPVAPYVKSGKPSRVEALASGASRQEAEAEARPEARPEAGAVIVTMTDKALQHRDIDHYQRGMLDAYAVLLKGGYLDSAVRGKKLGEAKQRLAEVAGNRAPLLPGLSGRQLQALNRAIDAVPLPAFEGADEPERTPIAEREIPAGVEFAGQQR